MRIGIFTDTYTPDINGVVTSIVTLQEALIEQGHEVFIITTKRGLLSVTYDDYVLRVPGIELKRIYGYKFTTPLQLRAYTHIKSMELDIIHVHTEFGVGVLGHIVGKMLKIPIVSTYHTTYEDYTHYVNAFNFASVEKIAKKTIVRLSRLFGSSSTIIIAPSNKTKHMLENYGIKREIIVVPTGLDLEKFSKSKMDLELVTQYIEESNIHPNDHVIVYVGRLAKEKSIQFIIDAFKDIVAQDENVKLILVGSGPSEEELKQSVESLGLSKHITFLGKIPSKNIPAVYHMADAFISASTTETQGLTYIEAMASELPIIARYDDVISELVVEGETGFCFTDHESLVEVVTKFFALPQSKKREMAINAENKVQIYDQRNFASRMIGVYERAMLIYTSSYRVNKVVSKDEISKVELVNAYETVELSLLTKQLETRGLKEDSMVKKDDLTLLLEDEKLAYGYKESINKLSYKDRTRKEIYDMLMQKTSLNAKQMNQIIDLLEKQDLINDRKFLENSIVSLREKLTGRHKMILHLRKRGVPAYLIDEYFTDDDVIEETNHALELAQQFKRIVKEPSVNGKKDKIRRRLISHGYDYGVAANVVSNLDFSEEEALEEENCREFALKAQAQLRKRNIKDSLMFRRKLMQAVSKKGFELDLTRKIVAELEGEFDFENYKSV